MSDYAEERLNKMARIRELERELERLMETASGVESGTFRVQYSNQSRSKYGLPKYTLRIKGWFDRDRRYENRFKTLAHIESIEDVKAVLRKHGKDALELADKIDELEFS